MVAQLAGLRLAYAPYAAIAGVDVEFLLAGRKAVGRPTAVNISMKTVQMARADPITVASEIIFWRR